MSGPRERPKLRRALIGGYKVGDVELALAQLELALGRAELDLASTHRQLQSSERLTAAQQTRLLELEALRSEAIATLNSALREQDELVQRSRLAVEAAEEKAARERSTSEQLRAIFANLTAHVSLLASDLAGLSGAAPEPAALEAAALEPAALEPAAPEPAAAPPEPPEPPEPPAALAGQDGNGVRLEAGPFDDLASLTAFERSVAAVPHVAEVYVRGFEDERATLELQLDQPSDLLRELMAHLPYALDVHEHDASHISLTVHEP